MGCCLVCPSPICFDLWAQSKIPQNPAALGNLFNYFNNISSKSIKNNNKSKVVYVT